MSAIEYICEKCGYVGSKYKKGKFIRRGRTRFVFFFLVVGGIFAVSAYVISNHCWWSSIWLIPLLIYTFYDVSGNYNKKCTKCKYEPLVPLNSKLGKKIQYSFEVPQQHIKEQEDTKECPFCAERIKIKAKICRFCNRELPQKEDDVLELDDSESLEIEIIDDIKDDK